MFCLLLSCLPVCLPAVMIVCLSVMPLVCLSVIVSACLLICLSFFQSVVCCLCMSVCLSPAFLSACMEPWMYCGSEPVLVSVKGRWRPAVVRAGGNAYMYWGSEPVLVRVKGRWRPAVWERAGVRTWAAAVRRPPPLRRRIRRAQLSARQELSPFRHHQQKHEQPVRRWMIDCGKIVWGENMRNLIFNGYSLIQRRNLNKRKSFSYIYPVA